MISGLLSVVRTLERFQLLSGFRNRVEPFSVLCFQIGTAEIPAFVKGRSTDSSRDFLEFVNVGEAKTAILRHPVSLYK